MLCFNQYIFFIDLNRPYEFQLGQNNDNLNLIVL